MADDAFEATQAIAPVEPERLLVWALRAMPSGGVTVQASSRHSMTPVAGWARRRSRRISCS